MPHHDGDHSEYALMVRDRPPDAYLWQRSSTKLSGGTSVCCLQDSHVDLTLPYWMGRYANHHGDYYASHFELIITLIKDFYFHIYRSSHYIRGGD